MVKPIVTGRRDRSNSKRKQTTREGRGQNDVVQVHPFIRKLEAASAMGLGSTERLTAARKYREKMIAIQAEIAEARAELHEVEGRSIRIGLAGFVPAAAAGKHRANLLRGNIQTLENRFRNAAIEAVRGLGLRDRDANFPIDLLHARGSLVGPKEDAKLADGRREVGARFAALYWKLHGLPEQAQTNGYAAPTNEEQIQEVLERAKRSDASEPLTLDERDCLDQARYDALRSAAEKCGRTVEAVVISACCRLQMPRGAAYGALRTGLQAMADAKMPSRSDAKEMAAKAAAKLAEGVMVQREVA